MKNNKSMIAAKTNKNDEFYTRLQTIEDEISMHMDYVRQFYGKTVLCNCDDPEWSNFFLFFRNHFEQLRLKKVIFTHYEPEGKPSYKLEWDGSYLGYDTLNLIKTPLEGNGDFRSPECVALLDECDIVVTNPPFSLFREFVKLIIDHGKDFVIIGNMNACTTKDIFPLMKEGKINAGYAFNASILFAVPDHYRYDEKETAKINDGKHYGKVPGIAWYTTFKLDKYNEEIPLTAQYEGHEDEYPKYDNYDAIEVNSPRRIPRDYDGVMGVFGPSFFAQYNREQFEVIGCSQRGCHDKFPDTKKYNDYLEYKKNGTKTGSSGSKTNENPNVVRNDGVHNYFMNKDGRTVQSLNARVFIRRKK